MSPLNKAPSFEFSAQQVGSQYCLRSWTMIFWVFTPLIGYSFNHLCQGIISLFPFVSSGTQVTIMSCLCLREFLSRFGHYLDYLTILVDLPNCHFSLSTINIFFLYLEMITPQAYFHHWYVIFWSMGDISYFLVDWVVSHVFNVNISIHILGFTLYLFFIFIIGGNPHLSQRLSLLVVS